MEEVDCLGYLCLWVFLSFATLVHSKCLASVVVMGYMVESVFVGQWLTQRMEDGPGRKELRGNKKELVGLGSTQDMNLQAGFYRTKSNSGETRMEDRSD